MSENYNDSNLEVAENSAITESPILENLEETKSEPQKEAKKAPFVLLFLILFLFISWASAYYYVQNWWEILGFSNEKIIEKKIIELQTKFVEKLNTLDTPTEETWNSKLSFYFDEENIWNIDANFELNNYKTILNWIDNQLFSADTKLELKTEGQEFGELNFSFSTFIDTIFKDWNFYLLLKDLSVNNEDLFKEYEQILKMITDKNQYIKFENQAVSPYEFDYKQFLTDIKANAWNPLFEISEKIEWKYYLKPTRYACDASKKIASYVGFPNTACSDEEYNYTLETFNKYWKLYISIKFNETVIWFEWKTDELINENTWYVKIVKDKITELNYSLKSEISNTELSYKDGIIKGTTDIVDTVVITTNGTYAENTLNLNNTITLSEVFSQDIFGLNWYSAEARDSKRLSDARLLISRITVEDAKYGTLSKTIKTDKITVWSINWEKTNIFQWTVDFDYLKENGEDYKDPSTWDDYVVAYSIGGTGATAYRFIQIATVSETKGKAVVIWNYFKIDTTNDSSSLIKNKAWEFVVNEWDALPYEINLPKVSDDIPSKITWTLDIFSSKKDNNIDFNLGLKLLNNEKTILTTEIDNKAQIKKENIPEIVAPTDSINFNDLINSMFQIQY